MVGAICLCLSNKESIINYKMVKTWNIYFVENGLRIIFNFIFKSPSDISWFWIKERQFYQGLYNYYCFERSIPWLLWSRNLLAESSPLKHLGQYHLSMPLVMKWNSKGLKMIPGYFHQYIYIFQSYLMIGVSYHMKFLQ